MCYGIRAINKMQQKEKDKNLISISTAWKYNVKKLLLLEYKALAKYEIIKIK